MLNGSANVQRETHDKAFQCQVCVCSLSQDVRQSPNQYGHGNKNKRETRTLKASNIKIIPANDCQTVLEMLDCHHIGDARLSSVLEML